MGKANGKVKLDEEKYLRYNMNALVEFEDVTGQGVLKAFEDIDKGNLSLKDIRALVWAGLLDYNEELTLKEAGDVMDECGIETTIEKLTDAIQYAFPDTKENDNPKQPANR